MDIDSCDWTGEVKVERCFGRSAATRVYGRYPLKLMLPSKVASSGVDAVWVFAVTYGGGILSGDSIACKVDVGDDCIMALTTQASTKIYKAVEGKSAEQILKATIGKNAVLVVLPDPVTCFASAKYRQLQKFSLASDANLVLVDWLTSGRRERGEVWSFDSYKSTNNVYVDDTHVFLDTMKLDQKGTQSIATRLQGFHSVAMLLIYGSRLQELRKQIHDKVRLLGQEAFKKKFRNACNLSHTAPAILFSCSTFGPFDSGLIVRMAANGTEVVYQFLKEHLAELAPLVGALPYSGK